MGIKIKKSRTTAITRSPKVTADPTAAPSELGNERFKGVVARVKKLRDVESSWAERHYALGLEVKTVLEDLAAYGLKQGAKAVKILAEETGYEKDTLYNAAKVAGRWSQAEFERWLKKKTKKGNPITFAIFSEVAKLEDPKAREVMLEDVREKDMSSRQVRAAVSGERPKREAQKKPKVSPLDQVVAASEAALDAATKMAASIKSLGEEKGAGAASAADRAAELQDALAAMSMGNAKALREMRDSLQAIAPILIASNPVPVVQMLEAAGTGEVLAHRPAVIAAPIHEGPEEEGPEEDDDDESGEEDEEGDQEAERDPDDVFEEMKRRHEDHRDEAGEEGHAPQSLNDALRDF